VEPCFPENALDVRCRRCRGDLKDFGYLPIGNETLADQVKNLVLPGREAGLPGTGIRWQPIRQELDHGVRTPYAMPALANDDHGGDSDQHCKRGFDRRYRPEQPVSPMG
jgi:hypothetical protein